MNTTSLSPVELYLAQENAAICQQLASLRDKNVVLKAAMVRTQQYVLELERRLEAMEEMTTRLLERESCFVQDAVTCTMEQMVLEAQWDTTDLDRILEDREEPDEDLFMSWMGEYEV